MDAEQHWHAFQKEASVFLPAPLTQQQMAQYQTLYEMVVTANQTMNLTRITALADFWVRHLLDSLSLAPLLKALPKAFTLIDIGSGAGFPVLPLAIAFPEAQWVAVEATQKKARFIETVSQALSLPYVCVLAERSEVLAHQPAYRGQFDIVVARAVAPLNVLAELCLPFAKPKGRFVAMKTQDALEQELASAKQALGVLGGRLKETIPVLHPLLPNRVLCVIAKERPTPKQYPRTAGLPAKKPL